MRCLAARPLWATPTKANPYPTSGGFPAGAQRPASEGDDTGTAARTPTTRTTAVVRAQRMTSPSANITSSRADPGFKYWQDQGLFFQTVPRSLLFFGHSISVEGDEQDELGRGGAGLAAKCVTASRRRTGQDTRPRGHAARPGSVFAVIPPCAALCRPAAVPRLGHGLAAAHTRHPCTHRGHWSGIARHRDASHQVGDAARWRHPRDRLRLAPPPSRA